MLTASLLLTGIAAWAVYPLFGSAKPANVHAVNIRQGQALLKIERDSLHLLDSAYCLIKSYKPDRQADFVETDIHNRITAVSMMWKETSDNRIRIFRVFDLAAKFYQMLYDDKKILQARNKSNELLKQGMEVYAPLSGAKGPLIKPLPRR
ncbi:hypothetical protein A8B98_22685 [Hymenobacter sp. UV11]|nr:hypothetical protein A8B98_22685 [Hymenobacter sp. UV11]